MPRYVYRLQPALAVAFGAEYGPGEWILRLRACSEAFSVALHLTRQQALSLGKAMLDAGRSFADNRFPPGTVAPCRPDSPLLSQPLDLESGAEHLRVLRHRQKRLLAIEASGHVDSAPFMAEIWATPEQLIALAGQIEDTCAQTGHHCPVCGSRIEGDQHQCRPAGPPPEH